MFLLWAKGAKFGHFLKNLGALTDRQTDRQTAPLLGLWQTNSTDNRQTFCTVHFLSTLSVVCHF